MFITTLAASRSSEPATPQTRISSDRSRATPYCPLPTTFFPTLPVPPQQGTG